MEVSFSSDLEKNPSRQVASRELDNHALVIEVVEHLVDHDTWFIAEVEKGLTQIDASQTLSHEEVGIRLQRNLSRRSCSPDTNAMD